MSKRSSSASVIKNRGFLNLWVNQILVQFSYNSLNFALIIWVFRLTDSNIAVSALLFSVYLPAVIFGLFAGVLADIIDRRKIISAIDFFMALIFFGLAFVKESYTFIILAVFFINALAQFYTPAESSALPIIVKKNQLLIANSLFSVTLYVTFLLGFALAGPLINHLGIDFVFTAGGIVLALAFVLSLAFPPITSKPSVEGRKLMKALFKKDYLVFYRAALSEIRQTIKVIRGKLVVLVSIGILGAVQMVVGILAVLVPSFLEKTLQITATDASYVLVIPLGLGMITGGLIIGQLGYKFARRRLVGWAITLAGLMFISVGLTPMLWPVIHHFSRPRPLRFFYQLPLSRILAVESFVMGLSMVSIVAPSQTVLQENTPEHNRGKTFAVLGVVMAGLTLIPVLLAGLLADIFGSRTVFLAVGSVVILIGLMALKPSLFFAEHQLSFRLRQFLGLGHWEK